jgi:hypothetical protein
MGDFNTPSVFYFSKENGGLKFVISKPPQAKCFANTRKKSSAYPNGFFLSPFGADTVF